LSSPASTRCRPPPLSVRTASQPVPAGTSCTPHAVSDTHTDSKEGLPPVACIPMQVCSCQCMSTSTFQAQTTV
jgi:hypothetical protein